MESYKPRKKNSGIFGKLCILFGTFIFLFCIVEVSLRVLGKTKEPVMRPSNILGWEHIPGARGIYNNLGLMMDHPVEMTSKKRRVLLIGDSFLERPIYKKIEEKLNKIYPGYGGWEVVNFGTEGYSPDQYYLWWTHYGQFIEADAVICFLYIGNDWGSLSQAVIADAGVRKPYFLVEDDKLVLNNMYIAEPEKKVPFQWTPIIKGERRKTIVTNDGSSVQFGSPLVTKMYGVHVWLREHVKTYVFIKDRLASVLRGSGAVSDDDRYAPADNYYFNNYSFIFEKDKSGDVDRIWNLMEKILLRFESDVREQDKTFSLVLIPHIWQIDKKVNARFNKLMEKKKIEVDLVAPTKRMEKLAAKNGWPLVNLYGPYIKTHTSDSPVYDSFGPEAHWNPYGQEVAAEAIADYLAVHPELLFKK